MALSRDQILSASDLQRQEIDVPEWGGSVFIRMMSAGEHARLAQDFEAIPKESYVFYLLSKTLCDETGGLLFPAPGDIGLLATKSMAATERVYEAVARLNKLEKSDVQASEKN